MNFDYLALACQKLGITQEQVMSHKQYEDHIALVVWPGPKYIFTLEELNPLKPEPPKQAEPERPAEWSKPVTPPTIERPVKPGPQRRGK